MSEPNHVICVGWPTIARLAAGEAVWFEDIQAGAVAADDLFGIDPRMAKAAPELYSALQDALDVLDIAASYGLYQEGSVGEADLAVTLDRARAALAKADPLSMRDRRGT